MRKLAVLLLLAFLITPSVYARVVEDVNVVESVSLPGIDKPLLLNGAGVRTRFIIKVYVGALYLPEVQSDPATILTSAGAKSIRMHFIHGQISGEKLAEAWTEGFKNNNDEATLKAIAERMTQFNRLFPGARRGDVIVLDFFPSGETRVIVNGETRGNVDGRDFQRAVLAIWLGERPADKDLKRAMLGASE